MNHRKVLLVNKFYHDKGPAGGVGRYLVQEEEDLLGAGWDVVPFAMADGLERPTPWRDHFVRARDYSRPHFGPGALGDAVSLIWNREAAASLDRLLTETRPDVAHLHNVYHHLSPSILPVLARHRIPVVMTLHDLRLLCPAIHMLRQGQVCERCKGGRFHQAVLGRCVKDSRAASLLAAVETAHQRWRGLYTRNVARFLCPSRFLLAKYAAWNFAPTKLRHLPNFVDLEQWHPSRLDAKATPDTYVYFGRISTEKGLRTLLDAHALWEKRAAANGPVPPPLKLAIAGEGPCSGNIRARIAQLELRHVDFLGPLDRTALQVLLGRARFTVLPSECYENGPMAVLESLAAGIPVVGSDLGGIPEMIEDGVTGVVVPPGDPETLLAGLLRAAAMPDAGTAARRWSEQNAARSTHMARLREILDRVAAGQESPPEDGVSAAG